MTLAISSGHLAPSHGVDSSPEATQRSLNASIAALVTAYDGALEYIEDPHRAAEDPTARKHRVCKFKCAFCAGHTSIDQYANDKGEWPSDGIAQAKVFGWQTNGTQWFCGKTCQQRYETKMRDHGNSPLPPAPSQRGRSAAREAYSTKATTLVTPPNAIDAQDIVPAAPPLTTSRRSK